MLFFLECVEKYATEIGDTRQPFSVPTWEKAFELWKKQGGNQQFRRQGSRIRKGKRLRWYMDRRLLLVDGSNLLFQMFFGMPSRIVNEQGKAIQGTLGFVGALRKIIHRVGPTHLAVLFDGEHENARAALDPEYKSNRADYSQVPEEENPFPQIDDVYAALDYMGIIHTETADCEADDLIAGYALTYGKQMDIVISSFDNDFFQLLTDRVSILRYRGKDTVIWTQDSLKEKFGIVSVQYDIF